MCHEPCSIAKKVDTSAQMLAMHEQGRLAGLEEAKAKVRGLISSHCESTQRDEDPSAHCHEEDESCDFVAAWHDVLRSLAAASIGAKMGEEG
jgi:hypothetical protein